MIVAWLLNALILMGIAWLIPGITITSFWSALGAVIIIGLINTFIKPIILLLTLPVTLVTLGLFYVVINAGLFYWAGQFMDGFKVAGFFPALWGSIAYAVLKSLLTRSD